MRSTNISVKKIDLTRKYFDSSTFDLKPRGLWYSIDNEWNNWCESEMLGWVREYNIEIKIKENEILIIKSLEDLENLIKNYKSQIKLKTEFTFNYVDWNKLREDYKGIEFQNYHEIKKQLWLTDGIDKFLFYFGLDCSSGCIWDLSCITKQKLIK